MIPCVKTYLFKKMKIVNPHKFVEYGRIWMERKDPVTEFPYAGQFIYLCQYRTWSYR